MAHIYVDSAAVGAGTGASWADAYTTLEAAAEAAGTAAGDSIWIANSHAETRATAMQITFKNTAAAPGTIMCVDKSGSVPPVAADLRTTATITTTGDSNIELTGWAYFYGITFSAGTGAVTAMAWLAVAASWLYFKNCSIRRAGTGLGTIRIGYDTSAQRVIFDNTTVGFGAVNNAIDFLGGHLLWKNTPSAIVGAIIPTVLIKMPSIGTAILDGVDLSALGTGTTIVGTIVGLAQMVCKNCKLGSDVILSGFPATNARFGPVFINCDSGDTNYRTELYEYQGSQVVETTIVHIGGASDGDTPIAWKITTTANAELISPFESLPISIWNETVDTITVSIEGIWGGGAVPNNTDIWMEVSYLGTPSYPLAITASSGPATVLTAGIAYAAGTGTWGGSTTKFKMSVAITPEIKGPITVRIFAANTGSIFYIDPKIVIS